MNINEAATKYRDARNADDEAQAALKEHPGMEEANTRLANITELLKEAKAQHLEAAKVLGLDAAAKTAAEHLEAAKQDLIEAWAPRVAEHGKTETLESGDQVQLKATVGVEVTEARALLKALDERSLWTLAVPKPEKLAGALDAKVLRPLCGDGEDALPGIAAADKYAVALKRAKGA